MPGCPVEPGPHPRGKTLDDKVQFPEQRGIVAGLVHQIFLPAAQQNRLHRAEQPQPHEDRHDEPGDAHLPALFHEDVVNTDGFEDFLGAFDLIAKQDERPARKFRVGLRVVRGGKRIAPPDKITRGTNPAPLLELWIVRGQGAYFFPVLKIRE